MRRNICINREISRYLDSRDVTFEDMQRFKSIHIFTLLTQSSKTLKHHFDRRYCFECRNWIISRLFEGTDNIVKTSVTLHIRQLSQQQHIVMPSLLCWKICHCSLRAWAPEDWKLKEITSRRFWRVDKTWERRITKADARAVASCSLACAEFGWYGDFW
jgi:hypothetical protein